MKLKGKSYSCVVTGIPTTTLHEIWPGSCNRKLCVKYNLQVPLAFGAHIEVHHGCQKFWRMLFCEKLGIDFDVLTVAINRLDKSVLESVAEKCKAKIDGWEV